MTATRKAPFSPVPGVTFHDFRPGDRIRVPLSGRTGVLVRKISTHNGWLVRWDDPQFGVEEGRCAAFNMEPLPKFKQGTVFRHGKWLEPSQPGREKAICRVTAIRRGVVYYGFGADARKGVYYTTAEKLLADGAEVLS